MWDLCLITLRLSLCFHTLKNVMKYITHKFSRVPVSGIRYLTVLWCCCQFPSQGCFFSSFWQKLCSLTNSSVCPVLAPIVCSTSEWTCAFDKLHKQNRGRLPFVAPCIQHVFKVPPCWGMCQCFLLFKGCATLHHGSYISLCFCWQTLELFLHFGSWK